TKVVVGHSGDSGDLEYLTWLADTGAILGMDRFGLDAFRTTPERVATIATLCGRGYTDRMVLSQDASCWIDWFGDNFDELRRRLVVRQYASVGFADARHRSNARKPADASIPGAQPPADRPGGAHGRRPGRRARVQSAALPGRQRVLGRVQRGRRAQAGRRGT